MQEQWKLYKMDKHGVNMVLDVLNNDTYREITDYIIAVQYDYLNNGYKELLEKMAQVPASQCIFTTSKFYNLLTNFVNFDYKVYDIKLNGMFKEDNELIQSYVNKLGKGKDRTHILEVLLEELEWYNYDEGIDIDHMTFGIESNGQRFRTYFYNNGVLAIDSEIIDKVFNLLKKIL